MTVTYGDESIKMLFQHYGRELPAQSVLGKKFVMPAFVNPDLPTEWKTFQRYIHVVNQPKENLDEQLKELSANPILHSMCPCLSTLAKVCLTIPVGIASRMKMIKTRLRNRLGETNLSHLMKIAIESPQTLSDEQLEQIVDI